MARGNDPSGTTPGRRTRVFIDTKRVIRTQPQYRNDFWLEKISDGQTPSANVRLVNGIGWAISSYQDTYSSVYEGEDADTSVIDFAIGDDGAGSTLVLQKQQRTPTELGYLGSVDTRASGYPVYAKSYKAGATSPIEVSGDTGLIPLADSGGELVPLDRVAVGQNADENHEPNEGLTFNFFVPGVGGDSFGTLFRGYFNSIPTRLRSETSLTRGSGYYALSLDGDGLASLLELRANGISWVIRDVWQWEASRLIAGSWHVVTITSDARQDDDDLWRGTAINFRVRHVRPDIVGNVRPTAKAAESAILDPSDHVYTISQWGEAQPIDPLPPVRIDVRRDLDVRFTGYRNKYRPTGVLYGHQQELSTKAFGSSPLLVSISGDFPTGTSVDIQCLDEDGSPMTVADAGATSKSKAWRQFTVPSGTRRFTPKITLNSSGDRRKTPKINYLYTGRDGAVEVYDPGEIEIENVVSVSISGAGQDPTHNTAQIVVKDVGGIISRMDSRAQVPIRVEVEYPDPEDPENTLTSVLFLGRIAKPVKVTRGSKGPGVINSYPKPRWGMYTLICVGEWARAMQVRTPQKYTFVNDQTSLLSSGVALPYKVTTAIRDIFQGIGYMPKQIDIPDWPFRFPADTRAEELVVEPYAPAFALAVKWAGELLGACLIWDENSTNGGAADDKMGCWRLLRAKRPTEGEYPVLAHFWSEPQNPGYGSVVAPISYPDVEGVKSTFMVKGTLREWVEPPEGNYVIATGIGAVVAEARLGKTNQQYKATRVVWNWKAANFGQGSGGPHPAFDPNHPDYTDGEPKPIWKPDSAITTQGEADFVARRIFDTACHTKLWKSAEAPLLLVWDPTDTLQIRARPLRFADYVKVDGDLNVVESANPGYGGGGDKRQHTAYEFWSVPALALEGNRLYAAVITRCS